VLSDVSFNSAPGFKIDGLMAGEYVLRVQAPNTAIASVLWNGQDYADRSFDGGLGKDFTDLVVTLTNASSAVAGTVTETGTVGAAVIAFPVERDRWINYGFNPTRLKSVLASQDGRFRVDGLPAGDYYLVAVPADQERGWIDPEFLNARAGRATRIHLDGSDSKVTGVSLVIVR
jgi:hypothetical protein